jgi:hypothetical protein
MADCRLCARSDAGGAHSHRQAKGDDQTTAHGRMISRWQLQAGLQLEALAGRAVARLLVDVGHSIGHPPAHRGPCMIVPCCAEVWLTDHGSAVTKDIRSENEARGLHLF